MSLAGTTLALTRVNAKHLFDVSSKMSGWCLCRGCAVPLSALSPCCRVFRCHVLVRNCASLETIQRSIELLYYRTSVPSNERLVREANVNATVAERGGRARAIRNHGPRGTGRAHGHARQQANPKPLRSAPRTGTSSEGRPNHLRLVVDHGRVIDPAFVPRQGARPAESVPNRGAGDVPRRVGATPGPAGRRRVRLTRRGRLVVTSTIVLLIAAASMVLASAAQAAGHP
jgi:hypothetical protein